MKCLVVIAHPLNDSLCHVMARTAIEALRGAGEAVEQVFPGAVVDPVDPGAPSRRRLARVAGQWQVLEDE